MHDARHLVVAAEAVQRGVANQRAVLIAEEIIDLAVRPGAHQLPFEFLRRAVVCRADGVKLGDGLQVGGSQAGAGDRSRPSGARLVDVARGAQAGLDRALDPGVAHSEVCSLANSSSCHIWMCRPRTAPAPRGGYARGSPTPDWCGRRGRGRTPAPGFLAQQFEEGGVQQRLLVGQQTEHLDGRLRPVVGLPELACSSTGRTLNDRVPALDMIVGQPCQ